MSEIRFDLAGKVAAITGGGGVLCGEMCRALAAHGVSVAVLDLRQDASDKIAGAIIDAGGKAVGVACDVLDKTSLSSAREVIEKKLGPVDILINGAGGNHAKGTTTKEQLEPQDLTASKNAEIVTFYDLDREGIDFVFDLNFLGTFLATQVLTRGMAERGSGVVVNISSMNAFTPLTKIPAYSAAKAAISNFTRWLAVHMAKVGVRVNAIAPGFFLTDQNRSLLVADNGSPTPRGGRIVDHTPLGRFGKPDDLTGALLWLVSDEASGFVTGTVVAVDGGFSAFSGV